MLESCKYTTCGHSFPLLRAPGILVHGGHDGVLWRRKQGRFPSRMFTNKLITLEIINPNGFFYTRIPSKRPPTYWPTHYIAKLILKDFSSAEILASLFLQDGLIICLDPPVPAYV